MRKQRERSKYTGDEVQLVTFKLGQETFAVHVNQVREIGKIGEITSVPKMPAYIEGVMNLRGQITTVIDLRKRLGITPEKGKKERIIVVEMKDNQLGIIVDSVEDVIRVSPQSIAPPPKMIESKIDNRFLSSICKRGDELIMLLDLNKLLSEKEIEEISESIK